MEIKDRILVVEDDKRISSFFKTVLESNRYDVIMASTGSEAVSYTHLTLPTKRIV